MDSALVTENKCTVSNSSLQVADIKDNFVCATLERAFIDQQLRNFDGFIELIGCFQNYWCKLSYRKVGEIVQFADWLPGGPKGGNRIDEKPYPLNGRRIEGDNGNHNNKISRN
jgi:hypothetical protein